MKAKAERFRNPKIACFGLTFKANIDDLRESPALQIVQQLAQNEVGDLLIVEPHVAALPESLTRYPHVTLSAVNAALDQADIVLGLVGHDLFKQIDQELLKEKIVIDCIGMWR